MHGPHSSSKGLVRKSYLNYDIWRAQIPATTIYIAKQIFRT